jgi:ABC-type transporter MlaC component
MDFRTTHLCRNFGRIFLLAVLCFPVAPRTAHAQADHAVAEFLGGVNQTMGQFSGRGGEDRTSAMCASLINSFFDFGALARVTSVGAWDKMNAQQRQAYRAAFLRRGRRDCVYSNSNLAGGRLTLVGTRAAEGGDLLVATEIRKEGQSRGMVVWRVRPDGNKKLHAVDVTLDGRSLAIQARNEAKIVLDRSAGDIDALIRSLEQ